MADRLKGKVAVVTGAGSRGPGVGNGKAAAVLMAREGAKVLCVDLHDERAQETVRPGSRAKASRRRVGATSRARKAAGHGFRRGRALRPHRHPAEQRWHPVRQTLADITEDEWDEHYRRQRAQHGHGRAVRCAAHDRGRRRRHHQPLLHRRGARLPGDARPRTPSASPPRWA